MRVDYLFAVLCVRKINFPLAWCIGKWISSWIKYKHIFLKNREVTSEHLFENT